MKDGLAIKDQNKRAIFTGLAMSIPFWIVMPICFLVIAPGRNMFLAGWVPTDSYQLAAVCLVMIAPWIETFWTRRQWPDVVNTGYWTIRIVICSLIFSWCTLSICGHIAYQVWRESSAR